MFCSYSYSHPHREDELIPTINRGLRAEVIPLRQIQLLMAPRRAGGSTAMGLFADPSNVRYISK